MRHEIVYGSDPQPSDHILRNLTIFYDKVYLLHPYGVSEDTRALWSNWETKFMDDLDYGYEHYRKWEKNNMFLFDEGLVEILPDVFDKEWAVADNIGEELIRRFGIEHLDNYIFNKQELLDKSIRFSKRFILDGKLALALHYGYAQTDLPHFIWASDLRWENNWDSLSAESDTKDNDPFSTTNIKNRLIGNLLSCDFPLIQAQEPKELLKLRKKYADEREGFMYYMNELSNSVRQHLRDGANPDEAAMRSLESEVLPKLREFKKQRNLTIKQRFLKYIKGFVNIDAALWSPKFFYQFSRSALGVANDMASDKKFDSTNRMQSFRLLARISK